MASELGRPEKNRGVCCCELCLPGKWSIRRNPLSISRQLWQSERKETRVSAEKKERWRQTRCAFPRVVYIVGVAPVREAISQGITASAFFFCDRIRIRAKTHSFPSVALPLCPPSLPLVSFHLAVLPLLSQKLVSIAPLLVRVCDRAMSQEAPRVLHTPIAIGASCRNNGFAGWLRACFAVLR